MASLSNLLFFFSFFLVSAAFLPALIAENEPQIMDEYWKERATSAFKEAQRAYNPNPEEVTDSVNLKVGKFITSTMEVQNSTRRHLLKRYNGPCMTTNPIDQCWRCDPNWAKNRKRLADCAIGFGRNTVGGKHGRFYIVTDPSDDDLVNPKPGTLRYAAIQTRPLWITFARSMIITLKEELLLTSDKTIDGRGSNVHIAYGAGITLQFVKNIIIHNIHIHDIIEGKGGLIRDSTAHVGFRTMSDGDGISLFGACNVWIDHVSMYRCNDGLIDVIMGSTGITISNSHFTDHNQVMLFGANKNHEQDRIMQITVAFNHFGRGLVQRMPRCRFGFVHVVNNDYTHWLMYAIGGSSNPTIISQGNRFIAPPNKAAKEVTSRYNTPEAEWRHWTWRSEGDLMMNGAFFVQSGNPYFDSKSREGMIQAKPGHMVTSITRFAGTLRCTKGLGC